MVNIKPTKFPENVIRVSDIGEGEYLGAARSTLIRLLELEVLQDTSNSPSAEDASCSVRPRHQSPRMGPSAL